MSQRFIIPLLGLAIMALAACLPLALSTPMPPQATQTVAPVIKTMQPDNEWPDDLSGVGSDLPYSGLTYAQADGNRLASGTGAVPHTTPLDIPLTGTPVWVVAAPLERGSMWVVALDDGQLQAFALEGRTVTPKSIEPSHLPPGMPPLLLVENGSARIVMAPPDASVMTHPVLVGGDGLLAYVAQNGDLVLWDGVERFRFAVAALPDARILVDERKRLLLLAGATERYDHAVLGDAVEASTVVLVETQSAPHLALTLSIPEPQVIEGIVPLWADLNGDGRRDILVTVSDRDQGARLVAYDEEGMQIAAGPAAGQGYRWRHQLAAVPVGLAGEVEVVEVLTPHIGGIVQFYRIEGDRLVVVDRLIGYTSHMLGSRNLDMAAAGDFDGDGRVELLLPDYSFQALGALHRSLDSIENSIENGTDGGIEVAWTAVLGGRMSTNLATTQLADGTLLAGVGRADGVLRLWPR